VVCDGSEGDDAQALQKRVRNLKNISKEVFPANGKALGINLVRRKQLALFRKHLALIDSQDYFEKAIENMIEQENTKFLPVNVDGLFCHEIDFPEDLEYIHFWLRSQYFPVKLIH